jgi:hypothetical protein
VRLLCGRVEILYAAHGIVRRHRELERPDHFSNGLKLDRLAALKARHEPTNLFRMNQNIAPASSA